MVILLIGILGSGKTSIGKLLAQRLRYGCIEFDDLVLEKMGCESVIEAYDQDAVEWMRCEIDAVKELESSENAVLIATDTLAENPPVLGLLRNISDHLLIIYLHTSPRRLTDRLVQLNHTFNKAGPMKVLRQMEKHYERRNTIYQELADFVVTTDESTPEEACEEILGMLKIRNEAKDNAL